jgi:hypothetical protein
VRNIAAVRDRKLVELASIVRRPGMYGPPAAVAFRIMSVMEDLAFIDQRDEIVASALKRLQARYGALGVPGIASWFKDRPSLCWDEVASTVAEVAHEVGYLAVGHALTAEEWARLRLDDLSTYSGRDWRRSEIQRDLPAPTLVVGAEGVFCYVSAEPPGGWVFLDFDTFAPPTPDPMLRDVRLPTRPKAAQGLVFTPYGRRYQP